jgi:hypothetical protein
MHLPIQRTRGVRRRLLVSALGLVGLLAAMTTPAFAVEPIDARQPETLRRSAPLVPELPPPAHTEPPLPTESPAPAPASAPDLPGLDVSWPQCGDELPEAFGFAVVGVNAGRVYSRNPCLGAGDEPSQLAWAGPDADLYLNTGNPGPEVSSYWPRSSAAPRECDTAGRPGADTLDCAYTYGWNAAADGYRAALDAFISLGWAEPAAERVPGERTWWLDVETANSWRADWSLNVASLQGAVDFLKSVEVTEVGFYSTPLLWYRVTGGTDVFADLPAWHAGALDQADALARCEDESFTGGELRMVQWVENDLDHNVVCPSGAGANTGEAAG